MSIRCPDCGKGNSTNVTNGKVKCNKCLQYIIIKDGEAKKCVPSSLY